MVLKCCYGRHCLDKKIKQEKLLLGDLPKLSVDILDIAKQHGRVTVNEVINATGANRSTIKDHIKSLHENGFIERHGAGRGTWYSLA